MKNKIFELVAKLAIKRPWTVVIVTIILVLISGELANNLKIKTNFKELMPQSHPVVTEYNNIVENYQGASMVIVGAIGKEKSLKKFVDEIAPEIETYKSLVKRVEYKLNKNFFENHGLMVMKTKDLKNSLKSYNDLGLKPFITEINNSFEKTYIADGEESISNKEKENNAIAQIDGLKVWIETMSSYIQDPSDKNPETGEKVVDKLLFGDEYFLSQDKNMIIFMVQPSFSVEDIDKSVALTDSIRSLIAKKLVKYPDITLAGPSGMIAIAADEMESAEEDMSFTTIIAFILILVLFIVSFRMVSAPVLAFTSLIIGIMLTTGFVSLSIGSLNIMTSMFAVILIGLGIDFNIHIISTYNQIRTNNETPENAIRLTFNKTANGVFIGALTTALAFFTLMVSENQGMKEFGLVAGAGVIFCVISSLLVLPSLIAIQEKIRYKKIAKIEQKMSKVNAGSPDYKKLENKLITKQKIKTTDYRFLGNFAHMIANKRLLVISIVIAVSVFLFYNATKLEFDYDYLELEPKGLQSIAIQDSILSKYDLSSDIVMITTNSVEESRELAEKAKRLSKIGMVSTISDYIPSPDEYQQKVEYIETIKQQLNSNKASVLKDNEIDMLIDELYRLEDNFIELAQMAYVGGQDKLDEKLKEITGDLEVDAANRKSMINKLVKLINSNQGKALNAMQVFQSHYEPVLRKKLLSMSSTEAITLENLPNEIKSQFISADGKQFLVSLYPKEQVWDGEFLETFSKQMKKLDDHVTGFPLIMYVLIDYIGKDGRLAASLALLVIFILLLLDFRSLKFALITLVPLIFGVLWMVGIMSLIGMKINILNAVGLPLILGMGVDTGVHVIHRYKIEGANKIKTIFSTTGKAVLISSLTSILAFGSLGFALYRGLASLGIALAIGITTCLLATIIILPAIISFIDQKK